MRSLIAFICLTAATARADETLRAELARYPHRLLCEAYDGENWELLAMRADGTGRVKLTETPDRHALYPQASPDGRRIAFLCDRDTEEGWLRSVEVMNLDGSDRRLVADKARQPCWDPDSRRLAYAPQEFSKFNILDYVSKGLVLVDLETGEKTPAANPDIHHIYGLNWSANGDWIVTTVHGGMGFRHAIIAIEIGGRKVVDLGVSGCRPCLSADGTRLAWSSDDHTISVAEVEYPEGGVRLKNQRVLEQREKAHLYHPDISPDGRYVAFSLGPGGRVKANGPGTFTQVAEMIGVRGHWNLYVKRFDGTGQAVAITEGADSTTKEPEWLPVASRDE